MTTPKDTYQRVILTDGDGVAPTFQRPLQVGLGFNQTTLFGEVLTSELEPAAQAYTHRAGDSRTWVKSTTTGGSIVTSNDRFTRTQINTTAGARASFCTKDTVNYRPGEGAGCRLTSIFTAGVANSFQRAGIFHEEDGVAFGYNGATFGTMHRYNGFQHIHKFTITTGAGGSENATITLNGTDHTVALTAGSTAHNATEIAEFAAGYADSSSDYKAHSLGSIVYFVRKRTGVASGAFSFSSSTAEATVAQERAGASPTETWTASSDWNIDPMDGTGQSGITLDPTKVNIYEIRFAWHGGAPIVYLIMDPTTGRMLPVHRVSWANSQERPSLNDPRMPVGYEVESVTSTTALSVAGGAAMGFIQGKKAPINALWSAVRSDVAASSTEIPVLSLQAAPVETADGHISRRRIFLDDSWATNIGNKDVLIRIYRGSTSNLVGYSFVENNSAAESNVWADSSATALADTGSLNLLRAVNVAPTSSLRIPFDARVQSFAPGDILIITAQTTSSTSTVTVTADGFEDL